MAEEGLNGFVQEIRDSLKEIPKLREEHDQGL